VATLYDDLGVGPSVTRPELHRAYRARARMLHPDARAGRPEAEIRAAEEAMARLNHAWHVLSDPDRRARYDAGGSIGGLPHGHPPDGPPEDDDDTGWLESRARGGRLFRPLPWMLLGGVMALIFVATAFAAHPAGTPPPPVVGQCLAAQPGLDRFVACGDPNDGRVVAESTSGPTTACPSGSTRHRVQGPTHFAVCLTTDRQADPAGRATLTNP